MNQLIHSDENVWSILTTPLPKLKNEVDALIANSKD